MRAAFQSSLKRRPSLSPYILLVTQSEPGKTAPERICSAISLSPATPGGLIPACSSHLEHLVCADRFSPPPRCPPAGDDPRVPVPIGQGLNSSQLRKARRKISGAVSRTGSMSNARKRGFLNPRSFIPREWGPNLQAKILVTMFAGISFLHFAAMEASLRNMFFHPLDFCATVALPILDNTDALFAIRAGQVGMPD